MANPISQTKHAVGRVFGFFLGIMAGKLYFFNVQKVRDHPLYIRAVGTGVCFYIDKFNGHP